MNTYTLHEDSGHGWLEVEWEEIWRFNIKPSNYSYTNGTHVFLEEDCDAFAFIEAKKATGEDYSIVTNYVDGDSPIRDYQRIC